MLTLQSTFEYECESPPPSDQVGISITYPRFVKPISESPRLSDDIRTFAVAAPVRLIPAGRGSLSFQQNLAEKSYHVPIPTANIFGSDYGAALLGHLQAVYASADLRWLSLSEFSLSFAASYGGEALDETARRLDALYFLGNIPSPRPQLARLVAAPPDDPSNPTIPENDSNGNGDSFFRAFSRGDKGWTDAIIDSNIYAINKTAYLKLLREIFPNINPSNETILLYIINAVVDLSGATPATASPGSETAARHIIAEIISYFDVNVEVDVYALVYHNFSSLFDFPIKMPCAKLLTVAGRLTINAPEGVTVTKNDFNLYHLSVDYVVSSEAGAQPNTHRHKWNPGDIQDSSASFSITESKVPQSRVLGLVNVKVKSFEGSEVWSGALQASDPALQRLDIVVSLRRPDFNEPVGTKKPTKKLRGKVVSLEKRCGGLQGVVVVQAKRSESDSWIAVASGESDKDGNFTLQYPSGKFTAARATSSLDPYAPAPLAIVTTEGEDDSISTDFIFILLSTQPAGADSSKKDCDCSAQHAAGRLPSSEELVASDQYTQDVGGTCLNLKTPNRVLREYTYTALVRTTDPDVANYTLSSGTDSSGRHAFYVRGHGKVKRGPIDLDNPVQWQDVSEDGADASLYQAVTIATGHVLYYRSEFRADGYSLGDLLYSLPLAPGQKKQIVVIDSNRTMVGTEMQSIAQDESLASNLSNERGIVDEIAGSLGETLAGRSSAYNEGVSAGGGASGSYGGMVGGSAGVAGGYSKANSSSSQSGKRDVASYFSEMLRQNIMQNAESHRQLNASVVTAVREGQRYNAETDVVANHNHCHSMTMMYFEVLRHFAVFQKLVDVQECIFVPLLMTRFSMANIPRWKDILASRLRPLPSNTYLRPWTYLTGRNQHPLLPGFDALERVKTNWSEVDYPESSFDQEPIRWVEGELTLNTSIPRPKTKYDFMLSLPLFTKTITRRVTDFKSVAKSAAAAILTGGLSFFAGSDGSRKEQIEIEARAKVFDAWFELDANYETVPPRNCIRFKSFETTHVAENNVTLDPIVTNMGPDDRSLWTFMARALGYEESDGNEAVRSMLTYYYKGQLLAEWDSIYLSQIAPRVFKEIVNRLVLSIGDIDFTSVSNYNGGERRMRITFSGSSSIERYRIDRIRLTCPMTAFAVLGRSPMILNVVRLRAAYSARHYNGLLYSGTPNGDLWDGVEVLSPTSAEERRDPRKEDRMLTDKLIDHLNYNLEYYNRVLWFSLDADRRFMLLDGFNIETYDKYGDPEGVRALSSVLKNQLITVAGNSLVFPVAPGFRVSQSLIVKKPDPEEGEGGEENGREQDEDDDAPPILDHYQPSITPPPYRISTSTKGVFMEAVMGSCDACEKVKPDSSQDWAKFGTDEPPSINPVEPIVPTVTDWKAAFKDFAPPMINIQNAPAAPDPGAGLAASGITQLLGKGDAFRDATGLAATQANAMQTYLSNQESAKAFASMASGMAMQAHNTNNSSKMMDIMKAANASGALPDKDYKALVKEHIQQQIDGGQSLQVGLEKQRQENQKKPTLVDVAAEAESKGKKLKASRIGGNGEVESVEVTGQGEPQMETVAEVEGMIPPIKQERTNLCWATSATMMVRWQKQQSIPVEDVLRTSGEDFVQMYRDNIALDRTDVERFIHPLGMTAEPPANYKISAYVEMMRRYGPLWIVVDSSVASDKFSAHARVLVAIVSDGDPSGAHTDFWFNDPLSGRRYTETFKEFIDSFERLVTHNDGEPLILQIVHFITELPNSSPAPRPGPVTGSGPGSSGNWLVGSPSPNASPAAFSDWMDLITFKTPLGIVHSMAPRSITVQKIEDAGSDMTNLDYFPVKIDAWPTVDGTKLEGEAFLTHVRRNFNNLIDPSMSSFWPLEANPDGTIWNSGNPLGAVLGITIFPDNGAVVCGEIDGRHWRFVTVRTPFRQTGSHPVSGTREFGLRRTAEGGIFYTRGVDRTTELPESLLSGIAFDAGAKLWRSLQAKVTEFINTHGGRASPLPVIKKTVEWAQIKAAM